MASIELKNIEKQSSSNYNSDPKQRLVGVYTSSWQEFNFPIGVYNFTTHLVRASIS